MVAVIAFDGDDTLWHSETRFAEAQQHFRGILAPYADPARADDALYAIEAANMALFGYGAKAFTLSMVETAIELSDGRVPAEEIARLLEVGKRLLDHPVELLDGASDALEQLSASHRVLLITKGDLLHQERKLAASGLAKHFDRVAIVSEKDPPTYADIIAQERVPPEEFVMVGNSVRSDVLPVLAVGGRAVHVPHEITWAHEQVPDAQVQAATFPRLAGIAQLPDLIRQGLAGPHAHARG